MSPTYSLVVGVASGVLASLFVFLTVGLFKKVVLPWYQQLIYRGVSLSGDWIQTLPVSEDVHVEAHYTFKQRGHRIEGTETAVWQKKNEGVIQRKNFKIEGQISDRIAMLTSRHTDSSKISGMVLLLEVVGDGSQMVGHTAYYSVVDAKVVSQKALLARTPRSVPSTMARSTGNGKRAYKMPASL